jgi:hypothetical protein
MRNKRAKAPAPPSVNVAHSGGRALAPAVLFWQETDSTGIKAKCEYQEGVFTVTVSKDSLMKTESFRQSFTPTFGMDVEDLAQSTDIAERLANELEKELYAH